nr:hypothetical protein [uncultured bacterium]
MRVSRVGLSVLLMACGGAQANTPVEHAAAEPAPPVRAAPAPVTSAPGAEAEATGESRLAVRGIEGSMSGHDVNQTMERRTSELAACQAHAVPALTGAVVYGIKVDGEGQVNEVTLRSSDLGDRSLERCVAEVIERTPFPRPNGGNARFTWTMTLEPASARAVPEAWEREQIEQVIDKNLSELHEECKIESFARHLGATAYVNKRGRVIAASVTGKSGATDEHLDCVVLALRKWRMPKPKLRFAKVSFPLKEGQRAIAQRRGGKKR